MKKNSTKKPKEKVFNKYDKFVIAILAIIQFSIILDFMVLSPLGAILMPLLKLTTAQFSWVVSAYAFSAGISGLLAAGFADKFDRKRLLLFFYFGFIIGTFLCAIANTYETLLAARIITGIFGGVIGSIGFAIITDIFAMKVRGRVMGFVQMAFAASQVLGLPIGLWLANHYGWHASFWMIAVFSSVVAVVILIYLKPISEHMGSNTDRHPLMHLWKTVTNLNYGQGFAATVLLATGGFMLMPFGSQFAIRNLGLTLEDLPWLYGITGLFSIVFGPLTGKLADKIGKFKTFVIGTVISAGMVALYTNLGVTPLWAVISVSVIMFVGISARMISSSALLTAVPAPQDSGAFMSVNSSIQQIAGGAATTLAGMIAFQATPESKVENYTTLGLVVIASMVIVVVLMYFLNKMVNRLAAENTNKSLYGIDI